MTVQPLRLVGAAARLARLREFGRWCGGAGPAGVVVGVLRGGPGAPVRRGGGVGLGLGLEAARAG